MPTDPKAYFKSARFWLAIITTTFACILTIVVVIRLPDGAATVVSQFFTVWAIIVTFYFTKSRPRENPLAANNGGQKP